MKNLKKWLLVLSFAVPATVNLSCTSAFLRDIRNSAIGAVSGFIGQTTSDILGQTLSPDGT